VKRGFRRVNVERALRVAERIDAMRPRVRARRTRPFLLLALGLSALVVAFWWLRLVAPGRFPRPATTDIRFFFYPLYLALFARAGHGELPLWNPYQLCGLPWLGSPQGGLFYPPHLLYLVLPTHQALAALGVLHLVLVALGTALFARRAGLGAAAA